MEHCGQEWTRKTPANKTSDAPVAKTHPQRPRVPQATVVFWGEMTRGARRTLVRPERRLYATPSKSRTIMPNVNGAPALRDYGSLRNAGQSPMVPHDRTRGISTIPTTPAWHPDRPSRLPHAITCYAAGVPVDAECAPFRAVASTPLYSRTKPRQACVSAWPIRSRSTTRFLRLPIIT